MSIRCMLGFHDWKPDKEALEVSCERCGKVNHKLTIVRLRSYLVGLDERSGELTTEEIKNLYFGE